MSDQSHRFLRALNRQPVDRTPIWMMRQAGRYLPEYRELRARAGDFMSLCKNTDFATEVTLQPLRRYPLDAAILFSDILTIPDAMGLGLSFVAGEGPVFKHRITSLADVEALPLLDISLDLDYVLNAVRSIRHELADSLPLIGFSGSPWTLATYMIEGGSSKDHSQSKAMIYAQPELMQALLAKLERAVADYLYQQVVAGAQAVQIFDSWGGALSHAAYLTHSLAPMQRIVASLRSRPLMADVPIIVFTKGGGQWLTAMADIGADCLGLDWTTDLGRAKAEVGQRVALQGNMDPSVLLGSPDAIRAEVARLLASYGQGTGHIFNLGHGITPQVDPEHARVFIEAVHQLSPAYHQSV